MTKKSFTWDSALSAFRPLIKAQGEVGYAYNLLQDNFFRAFIFAVAIERPGGFTNEPEFYSYALALWHVLQNDRLQRQYALTALENIPTKLDIKGGVERLKWAKKMADKLAEYRNLVAHAPMGYEPRITFATPTFAVKRYELIPRLGGLSTRPPNVQRLRQIKTVRFGRLFVTTFSTSVIMWIS
jgi:hypothetical protein